MQIKSPIMNQWPPSPSVEDEVTALANEHSLEGVLESLKTDNQGATLRGSVDQYPILINTADLEAVKEADNARRAKREPCASDMSSSDDSAGPSTPPPFRRQDRPQHAQAKSQPGPTTGPTETTGTTASVNIPPSRSRPQVTRIQTDIGGEARVTAAGPRRHPSLHPVARASTVDSMNPKMAASAQNMSPPQQTTTTSDFPRSPKIQRPTSNVTSYSAQHPHIVQSDYRSTHPDHSRLQGERADQQAGARNAPTFRYDAQSQPDPRASRNGSYSTNRHSFYEIPARTSQESPRHSPSQSRRQSRDSTYSAGGDGHSSRYRPAHSRTSTLDVWETPFTSSTDESSHEQGRNGGRGSGNERRKSRRRSSHRSERPTLIDMGRKVHPESVPTSAVEPPRDVSHYFEPRDSGHSYSLTPITNDASRAAMENYVEKAFKDNESRKLQNKLGVRQGDSTLVSPMGSPPRTPRLDRQSKDYFEYTPVAQKQHRQSRPPSMDEGQLRDSRRNSLLSAATTGAAMATRGSAAPTKPSGLSIDTHTTASTCKGASTPLSRRPSTVSEEVDRVRTDIPPNHTDVPLAKPLRPAVLEAHQVPRGQTAGLDHSLYSPQLPPHSPSLSHPTRALSYSGPERLAPWNGSYPPSAVSPNGAIAAAPVPSGFAHPRSTGSSFSAAEAISPVRVAFSFPVCLHSQPTIGSHDWYTMKDLPNVDVCSTCMNFIRTTRYRDLFVPSLPRPYNEPSVCVMSKPWVRIAFLQSLRRNRSNLHIVRDVVNLPKDTRPCAGGKSDIRKWFHVFDPQTRQPVPDFLACSACVRAIDDCFPCVGTVFEKPKHGLNQEFRCSMHAGNKHFDSIIEQLEQAEIRCRGREWRSADVEPLVRHIHRVARYQPCPRDELQTTRAWHFMPDLPEFTVCEACYDEVVRPVQDRLVARDVSKALKIVPRRRGSNGMGGISCQLYSERMRKVFRDAVASRDSKLLHDAVHTRVSAQQRLNDINKLYEQDLKLGIDRRKELERNREIWQTFE